MWLREVTLLGKAPGLRRRRIPVGTQVRGAVPCPPPPVTASQHFTVMREQKAN